jgi:NAD(P)H-dependent FMN reductase
MPRIMIIIGSTRRERLGDRVGQWVTIAAEQRSEIDVDTADLQVVNLPLFDERTDIGSLKGDFAHEEGRLWNERLTQADGFIMVTPEYNHGPPASLKNAIDYGWKGWHYKPVSFVSYSNGAIAGARAVEQLRLVVQGVKLLPLPSAVHIVRVQDEITTDGSGATHQTTQAALNRLLDELLMMTQRLSGRA